MVRNDFPLIPPFSFVDEHYRDFSRIPPSLFRYAYYEGNFINYSLKNNFWNKFCNDQGEEFNPVFAHLPAVKVQGRVPMKTNTMPAATGTQHGNWMPSRGETFRHLFPYYIELSRCEEWNVDTSWLFAMNPAVPQRGPEAGNPPEITGFGDFHSSGVNSRSGVFQYWYSHAS